MLNSQDLEELVNQIKQIDRQEAQQKLEKILATMTQGNHNQQMVEEFKREFRKRVEKESQLPVPMDLIEIDSNKKPENVYEILQAFDELVGTLTLDEAQKETYEAMKDIVAAGERKDNEKNIRALQNYVAELTTSQENHLYPLVW